MNSLDTLLHSMPSPAHRVLSAVWYAQLRHGLFPVQTNDGAQTCPVVVGVSGGADSVCLLHVLSLLAEHWHIVLHAAHIDHGLRAESGDDAEFVRTFAEDLGVEFHSRRLNGESLASDKRGVEAAARAHRYSALAEIAGKVAERHAHSHPAATDLVPSVAVAHHKDDQAETVLMNLVRGSGLRGFSGMPWIRTIEDGTVGPISGSVRVETVRLVRPLLGISRSCLRDYLSAFGLTYREDESNRDTAHLRNRIRLEIMPALAQINPQIVDTLARTAEAVRPEAKRAESLNEIALASVTVQAYPPLRYVLDANGLVKLSVADQRGAIRIVCERMGLDMRDVGLDAIEELLWRLRIEPAPGASLTLSGIIVWSVLSPHADDRLLLSVHRQDALPLEPVHPHLSQRLPHVKLPYAIRCPGTHALTARWTLTCRITSRDDLPRNWNSKGEHWRAFIDADAVDSPILSEPVDGLRFAPLGMSGHHKTLGDIFTDLKTPVALRPQWPIVVDARDGSVLWVCGYTISHMHRITSSTRRVLCLAWERNSDPAHPRTDAAPVSASSRESKPCTST